MLWGLPYRWNGDHAARQTVRQEPTLGSAEDPTARRVVTWAWVADGPCSKRGRVRGTVCGWPWDGTVREGGVMGTARQLGWGLQQGGTVMGPRVSLAPCSMDKKCRVC